MSNERTILQTGYVNVRVLGHPRADKWGWIKEHMIVAEQKLGRYLLPNEHVHHIDCNRQNNHPDNLMVVDITEHQKYHSHLRRQISYKKPSTFLGVAKRRNRPSPWFGNLMVNGKQYLTSCFKTEEEAAKAYDNLVKQHLPGGKLNFPDDLSGGEEGEEEE